MFAKGVATRSKPTIKPSSKPLKVVTAFLHFNVLCILFITKQYLSVMHAITFVMIIEMSIYNVIVFVKYESMVGLSYPFYFNSEIKSYLKSNYNIYFA